MNKRFHLLGILLLINTSLLFSQTINQKADSILLLIEKEVEDSVKAKHYIRLGGLFVYSEPEKSTKYLHQALAISRKIDFEKTLDFSYRLLFNVHDVLGSHSDSLMTYIKLLDELYQKTGKEEYELRVHWNTATYHRKFGKNDKVIEEYLKALALAKKINFPKTEQARLLGNIGGTLDINGNYEEALKYYQQATELFGDDKISQSITYFNMAIIYSKNLEQIDTALQLLDDAYEIANDIEYHSLIAGILIEQGYCYDIRGKYKLANQLYNKALDISETHNLGENFIAIQGAFAEHYLKRNQHQLAIEYANKGVEISLENEDFILLVPLYEVQEKCYVNLENYKKAYEVKNKLTAHLDSLNDSELQSKFKELQTKYEVDQKEFENELLKAEIEIDQKTIRSRTAITAGLIAILLLVAGWSFFIYRNSQQRKKYNAVLEHKVAERTKKLEQANYELRTFNYIASHDIKEPIRVIGGYASLIFKKLPDNIKANFEEYFDAIKRSTNQLYTLVEDFAYYSTLSKDEQIKKEMVDLNLLANNVTDNLNEMILSSNGKVIVNDLPTIDSNNSFLFTALKNLVENGLKYNDSEQPKVEINYKATDTNYQILVTDNGIGIENKYQEQVFIMFKRLHSRDKYEGSGIGLSIVKLVIEKLGGTVSIDSEMDKGTTFTLSIPK